MRVSFLQLRAALMRLSLEPDEQRKALEGMAVTDELALDLHYAVSALNDANEKVGITVDPQVIDALSRLDASLDAPADAELWADQALDRHPVWAEARATSRTLLGLLPVD